MDDRFLAGATGGRGDSSPEASVNNGDPARDDETGDRTAFDRFEKLSEDVSRLSAELDQVRRTLNSMRRARPDKPESRSRPTKVDE